MTATKNNVPPNSTLVMTVLVLRTSPSRKPCTLRSPPVCFRSTESTPRVVLLPRIHLLRTRVNSSKEGTAPCAATAETRALGQTVNAREFSYSTCCTLQPLEARQCRGRGFGIEFTADVLLTKPLTRISWVSRFYRICRKKESRQADSNR